MKEEGKEDQEVEAESKGLGLDSIINSDGQDHQTI